MSDKEDIEDSGIDESSAAVQTHLGIIQSVIQRMASNSTSCKAWCITLVSAILVVIANKTKPEYAFIALIPTLLFFVLDTYYLLLENRFRNSYDVFIYKLHCKSLVVSDLYSVSPSKNSFKQIKKSIFSFSIWPFYLTLIVMILIAKKYII